MGVHLEANIWREEPQEQSMGGTYLQGTEKQRGAFGGETGVTRRIGGASGESRAPGAVEKEVG